MKIIDINHIIDDHQNICIFRHVSPDGDAIFSQYAVKQFFIDNFPDKDVRCIGSDLYDIYPKVDSADDSFIEKSLAIILDTATENRVDDDRWKLADFSIKIDHHPNTDEYADYNYVDDTAASCCQVLAEVFYLSQFSRFRKTKKLAKFLYSGIVADTINFTTSSTTAKTLELASKLASTGLNISEIYENVFSIKMCLFKKISAIRQMLITDGKFGYCLLEQEDINRLKIKTKDAKNAVSEFSKINDLKVWTVIIFNKEKNAYEASIRSKKGYPINKIAIKYGGGGHVNASGVKSLTKSDVDSLLIDLKEVSSNNI